MWLNFKISQKGLILVTVPLLFEVAFIILLTTMLRQSELETESYAQSRQIVSEVNNFTKAYLDLGVALIAWKATRHSNFVREYDQLLTHQEEIYHKLETLSADSPVRLQRLQKLHDASERIRELTGRVRKMAEGDISARQESVCNHNPAADLAAIGTVWSGHLSIFRQSLGASHSDSGHDLR